MKVVVNRCYGGFGISQGALVMLIQRGCTSVYSYPDEPPKNDKSGFWAMRREQRVELADGYFQDSVFGNSVYKDGMVYNYSHDESARTDPTLIALIEEIGPEEVSGQLAKLKVVEIPDDIEWTIDDYDGMETIEESHRSW